MIDSNIGAQLSLFVNPQEVIDKFHSGEWDSVDNGIFTVDLWAEKLSGAFSMGYVETIAEWQDFHPVVILARPDETLIGNGHHRIAASAYAGMSLIPVVWSASQTFATISLPDDNDNPYTMDVSNIYSDSYDHESDGYW